MGQNENKKETLFFFSVYECLMSVNFIMLYYAI